jgi:hypothetical protein
MLTMKSPLGWILLGAAAVILFPLIWRLFTMLLSLAFGLAYIAAIVVMVIFVIGLIRRMLVAR